jgi:hypothetical protein
MTVGGNILGVGSHLPLAFKGTYDQNRLIFGGTGQPIFGDMTVRIEYTGITQCVQANDLPVQGISQVSATGP